MFERTISAALRGGETADPSTGQKQKIYPSGPSLMAGKKNSTLQMSSLVWRAVARSCLMTVKMSDAQRQACALNCPGREAQLEEGGGTQA